MTRMHGRRTEVVAVKQVAGWRLASPQPGHFHPTITRGPVTARDLLGTLSVLGQTIELVIPAGVTGWIDGEISARTVDYGDPIATLIPAHAGSTIDETAAAEAAQQANGPFPYNEPGAGLAGEPTRNKVFRAPTSGRYYGRPAPDKPAFVTAGMELAAGSTVCLLEVMKTFNRVLFDGDRVRVKEVLVAEGADVNAGDPILALEPI